MPRPTAKPNVDTSPASPVHEHGYVELDPAAQPGQAALAEECALAIAYNGINHAVMMVSPTDVEDFIAGFSLSGGLVDSIDEIYDIRLQRIGAAINAEVDISSRAFWALKQQRRQLAGTSGCGLCGVEALEQALPKLAALSASPLPPPAHLDALRDRLADAQRLARHSGALHAAAFIDGSGALRLCREDIGRHNALDKLIGALLREQLDPRQGFAVVTSRCSLELIHKSVRAGIGTLLSLSAPTDLAVDWARRHRLNLIHLPHRSAPRVYSPAPPQADAEA
ncbi:formate dehydrogenase accessory sulfurtransferase FdhD [Pseudomonas zhanjiangensis]|uniref:Sulfur carrier protein FdhD n=1 Tax=Pseudomonas zhanjiangensis TaxID=3239015 RepID=A0ABV3YV05_9PSED